MIESDFVDPVVAVAKRSVDIAGACLGLLLGGLVAPLIALAIRLDSPGPALYRQLRVGRAWPDYVALFWMYKFRSMYLDAEARTGPVWARKDDPRVTRVGRFLRQTRLDEIPQLVNVLRGEMSLIGPRPERPGICNRLEGAIPFYGERTYGVRPGITGLAQVRQGYDSSIEDVRSKVSYDHAYALSLSRLSQWLRMELEIVYQTVKVVVSARGQ